jgi:phage-related protein/predicted XRE-type DNA-binding protein
MRMGHALHVAQQGGKVLYAKPLRGLGGGATVIEIVVDHDGETFRNMYCARIGNYIYVLHAFQKKSKKGIETPKLEMDLVKTRLKTAKRVGKGAGGLAMKADTEDGLQPVIPSSGNVFADLALPDSEELLVKSKLAMKIAEIISSRGLSQTQASAMLGIPQPKVSMIQNGKLRGFSVEKLCQLLTLLGRDVDIVVKDSEQKGVGHLRVTYA